MSCEIELPAIAAVLIKQARVQNKPKKTSWEPTVSNLGAQVAKRLTDCKASAPRPPGQHLNAKALP